MNTAPKLQELQSRLEQVALRLDPSNSKPIASTLSSFRQVTDEVRNISASLAALAPPSGEGVCQCAQCRRDRALNRAGSPFIMDPLPEHDASKSNREQGLYRKYDVRRADGSDAPGGKHHGCEYFVLDTRHDKLAMVALTAYAIAAQAEYPDLARDLAERYGLNITTQPSGEGVIPAIDVFRIAGELIAKYEIRQRNFGGLKANEWAIGSHQQISDFLDDLRTLATPPPASLEREDNWPENLPAWRK